MKLNSFNIKTPDLDMEIVCFKKDGFLIKGEVCLYETEDGVYLAIDSEDDIHIIGKDIAHDDLWIYWNDLSHVLWKVIQKKEDSNESC